MKEKIGAEAISIKSPCSESWDEMFGNEKTRACSHCEKNVNDISMLTEDEAWKLIDESNGNLCVRYEAHPVTNAPIFADKLYQITRRTGVAAGVLGATLAVSTSTYAQEIPTNNPIRTGTTITNVNQTKNNPIKTNKLPKVTPTPTRPKLMGKIAIRRIITNPLMVAVQQGKGLKVGYLIATGVDVNEKDTNYYSRNALHVAVESNNLKIAKKLLNAGADIDAKDEFDRTPLMMIRNETSIEIIHLFAQYDATLNAKNQIGQTALMEAVRVNNFEAMKALLEAGADARGRDNHGNSALDIAHSESIKQILIAYGAERKAENK